MILVFFMYDPIKTETWLIIHLWFLQYSSIQPNGFYDIRMKKFQGIIKRRMLYSTHMAHNTIMFPIKAFGPSIYQSMRLLVKRRRILKMYRYIILIEMGRILNILKMWMYCIKTYTSLLVFNSTLIYQIFHIPWIWILEGEHIAR